MATLCELCDKKMSLFDGFHSPADVLICDKCYALYEKVLDSVSDIQTFKGNLVEFQNAFSGREGLEKLVKHLNDLHKAELLNVEEKRREEGRISESKNSIDSDESILEKVNSNIGPFENKDISSAELNNNAEESKETTDSIGMFGNIGGKIKTLAQVVTWIGIIGSVICGFVLMGIDEDLIFTGFIIALLGSLSSWVSSFVLYGFGQLIENTDKLVELAKNKKSD